MASNWQIVAFPLILPWREDFWTLPLYFPDLKVGVASGWPGQLPYQGLSLPPEAQIGPREYKHYKPGELHQWTAFEKYQQNWTEAGDLLEDLRHYGRVERAPLPPDSSPDLWSLAWQIEKLQSDQEAQLALVDRGQDWLQDILAPEPWEDRPGFGPAPDIPELVDRDLARLRFAIWRHALVSSLTDPWVPLLLGRTSRSLFLTLRGWPERTGLQKVQFSLPGVQNAEEWLQVCGGAAAPPWQGQAVEMLKKLLDEADDLQGLEAAVEEFEEFVAQQVRTQWPFPVIRNFDLELWVQESSEREPVLCWTGAGGGILPG